ncbi:MAG: beta-galactosidase [Bacteroidetes bacterium]|nr:beta-galactosidase [Bacteroidota bacterium]
MKKIIILFLFVIGGWSSSYAQQSISLAGEWRFQLDPLDFGKTDGSQLYLQKLNDKITLPGSTDLASKGIKTVSRHVDRLTRVYEYMGPAWYQRDIEIPENWNGKSISLSLERCHWVTTIYIDDKEAGTSKSLCTPNELDLTKFLSPGKHQLTICIDNRIPYPMDNWSHAFTEYTQTNWNGVIGKIELQASDPVSIIGIQVYPDVDTKKAKVDITIKNTTHDRVNGTIELSANALKGTKSYESLPSKITFDDKADTIHLTQEIFMGSEILLWDEFTPSLYTLKVNLKATNEKGNFSDLQTTTFGMRKISHDAHSIFVNDRRIDLRGTLECAVFPKTGFPPTDTESWIRICRIIKSYGLNHIRFHSWCPPAAAFNAADQTGVFLQVELPMWLKDAGKHEQRDKFFTTELISILDTYGNHPSFILFDNGNELEGDFNYLEGLVNIGQKHDPRHLYSASTARTHVKSDDFYVSHVTTKGSITVYEGKPSTDWDREKESDIDCPVIGHEAGQRCMYPNFKEIEKYDGVTRARNFEVFRESLEKSGMADQADDFLKASGALTVLEYKDVIEAFLRTKNGSGFQLLDLHDFPGQGTALIGILDPFWDSKGLITPERWSEFCSPTVPLLRFAKRSLTNAETFTGKAELYHYGDADLKNITPSWTAIDEKGNVFAKGKFKKQTFIRSKVTALGEIKFQLSSLKKAQEIKVIVSAGSFKNEWRFWIFPTDEVISKENSTRKTNDYILANNWNTETKQALEEGKNVLLIPDLSTVDGLKTEYPNHFWNPIMFMWPPMTLGCLIQNNHPALANFPTSTHTDWQWWDILRYAKTLNLNETGTLKPIVQVIDNYLTNKKLGVIIEAKVGKGKMLIATIDFTKDITKRPAAKQLLFSLKNYINSNNFVPKEELKFEQIDKLFKTPSGIDTK